MKFLFLAMIMAQTAWGKSLTDYKYFDYKVLFTNPECSEYKYDEPVESNAGDLLTAKPKNVYCTWMKDARRNQKRKDAPHYNIKQVLLDKNVEELFLTFLSFSNTDIVKAVCRAIEKNNTKVTLIIDSNNRDNDGRDTGLLKVANCRPDTALYSPGEANIPRTEFRGNIKGLGYAHNKIIIAHYKDSKKVKLVYASANMSSGTHLHHENWHFVTTSTDSHFYQAHQCIRKGMLNYASSKKEFVSYIGKCRNSIRIPEESDIKLFIVPSEGDKAMKNILKQMRGSKALDLAAHRFTHNSLVEGLSSAARRGVKVRMVLDDDVYWAAQLRETVGSNMVGEYYKVQKVARAGARIKYMQTNETEKLLHHNKYIIFDKKSGPDGVHCGAGNFTVAAFSRNFENFYYITIPSVVNQFKKQYRYKWGKLASDVKDLPAEYVHP